MKTGYAKKLFFLHWDLVHGVLELVCDEAGHQRLADGLLREKTNRGWRKRGWHIKLRQLSLKKHKQKQARTDNNDSISIPWQQQNT